MKHLSFITKTDVNAIKEYQSALCILADEEDQKLREWLPAGCDARDAYDDNSLNIEHITETTAIVYTVQTINYKGKFKGWFHKAYQTWIIGIDDGNAFAHAIPATCKTVSDAISWMIPEKVKKADKKIRQGDVWFVFTGKKHQNFDALPTSHKLIKSKGSVTITHHQHPAVTIQNDDGVKVYINKRQKKHQTAD